MTYLKWPSRFPRLAGALVVFLGVLVLIGWALDIAILKSVSPGWVNMSALTALVFTLAGTALWCRALGAPEDPAGHLESRAPGQGLARVLAGLVILISLAKLGEYLGSWNFDPDLLLFRQERGVFPLSAMSPATAFDFLTLGSVLLVADSRFFRLCQFLALLGLLIGWLGFSHYLYGGEPLLPYAHMAAHTAIGFLFLSAGTLCLRTDHGLMELVVSESPGGAIARRLLPAALALPVIIGLICLEAQRAGWFGTEAGVSLFALSNALIFGGLIWAYARLLHQSDKERKLADNKTRAQLERLNLLQQITRAIAERQDLLSIFQVVVRRLEDDLPIDFGCVFLYDQTSSTLTVRSVGVRSKQLGVDLAMSEHARVDIDENGLGRCVRGQLVYEADISQVHFPFPQRLAKRGLRSLVMAPLMVESGVFGVLVAARCQPSAFTSAECEFLKQLSEHTGLAAHHAQLYETLEQAYEDLRKTQQAVMEQERLRSLGEMASGIAHDINNAISPISLYTQWLLEQEPGLSDRARDRLRIIERAIGDVAATVARMREFYRQRQPQSALLPVNMNPLVQRVIDHTRARWSDIPQQNGTTIQLVTELADELPALTGVESEIREALVNLIFNAVDAMPEGGTLAIRTGLTESVPHATPQRVYIDVADTGVGMDAETQGRCLEPFFTTKGERGSGLGLAMVYGIVRRHGAEINIQSTIGKGTTIRLSFAIHTATEAAVAAAEPMRAFISRLRILVVDDDPVLLQSLRDTLASEHHMVATASGGQEGISAFVSAQKSNEPFDIVITDLGMPHLDGRKVASAVKNASPGTPVILLTGWGHRLVAENEIPPQVDRVLSKPPNLHELRAALISCHEAARNR